MDNTTILVVSVLATFVACWIPATVLLWRTVGSIVRANSVDRRAEDRERHDLIHMVERLLEKHMTDANWCTNIHAAEREREKRYDTSLVRDEIRTEANETPPAAAQTSVDPNMTPGWPYGRMAPLGDTSEVLPQHDI